MTKEERRQELTKQIEQVGVSDEIKGLCFTIFDRTYDDGFADGVKHGLEQSAKIQDMVFGAMRPKVTSTL